MRSIAFYFHRLRQEKRPFKFLLSRFLWETKLVQLLPIVIDRGLYKVYFSPTVLSAVFWLDPDAKGREEEFLISYLRMGDVVVDIGANIGSATLTAAAIVGNQGTVFSAEPHPTIFKALKKNVMLNSFSNVRLFNVAIGAQKGIASFSSKRSDNANHIVLEPSKLRVQVERLDALLLPHNPESREVMKVDVEGYEKYVFEGAPQLLQRTQCIFFECIERFFAKYDYTGADVFSILRASGFSLYEMRRGGNTLAIRDLAVCRSNSRLPN